MRFASLKELETHLLNLADGPETDALRGILHHTPVNRGKVAMVFSRATATLKDAMRRERDYPKSLTHAFWHGPRNTFHTIHILDRLPAEVQQRTMPVIERNLLMLCAMMKANPRTFNLFVKPVQPMSEQQQEEKQIARELLHHIRYVVYPELVRLTSEKTGLSVEDVESHVSAQIKAWKKAQKPELQGFEFVYPMYREAYEAA